MPWTCWTFLVGVLAIAGTGIPGIGLGIGGYFSKDEILAVAWHRVNGGEAEHHAAGYGDGVEMALAAADTGHGHATKADASAGHGAAGQSAGPVAEKLPYWLFLFPVFIAYVTPFYMMRCWWMTFMGKPRDDHVYEHAHESKLMYAPLVALAVGTVFASYWLFRPMVADSAPTVVLSQAFDGHAHDADHAQGALIDHGAHTAMIFYVGFAFVVGFGIAYAIYKNGLAKAEGLKARLAPVHKVLWHKFYFDEVYNTVFVYGTSRVVAVISWWIDKYVIDGVVNLAGWVTRVVADVSGNRMDARGMVNAPPSTRARDWFMAVVLVLAAYLVWSGFWPGDFQAGVWIAFVVFLLVLGVDGLVNDLGGMAWDTAGMMRRPQSGNIRTYVILAAGAAAVAIVLVLILVGESSTASVELVAR
jgi:NADH:ubiquinone oxidoreductase subunit 5 (subunit L)/multisubunit Na+/H+ antiporter MnhA subunit